MTSDEFMERVATVSNSITDGDIEHVKGLLSADGALLTFTDPLGSWLHCAAGRGQKEIVEHLITKGLDVNFVADAGGAPIGRAAANGHTSVVQCLLRHGAELPVDQPTKNALFASIYRGHTHITQILMDAGLDPHVVYRSVTGKLKNALSYAMERGHTDMVNLLTSLGCVMPVEGVDIPVNEVAQPVASASQESDAVREILDHMSNSVGPVESLALQEIVPVDDDVHVAINVIKPNENCPFTTLFTTGMTDAAMNVPEGQEEFQYAELVMYLPGDWQIPQPNSSDESSLWPFQWLRQIAYYPHLNET